MSTHHELSVQSGRHLPCLLMGLVGWLVEFWCTRSRNSAPLIIFKEHGRHIDFIRNKNNKSRPPPASFSEKLPETHC